MSLEPLNAHASMFDTKSTISKEELHHILQKLLQDIDIVFPAENYDVKVKHEVQQHFVDERFSKEFMQRLAPIIEAGSGMGAITYHSTSFDNQRSIGILTTYLIVIDEFAPEMSQELKDFNTDLLYHRPQLNPLLRSFTRFLGTVCSIYGQFSGDMIIKDSMQFISACYLEGEAEKQFRFPAAAPYFADYFRFKTGLSEAYAIIAFPEETFPEDGHIGDYLPAIWYMQLYINRINDILSFYKEMVQDEHFGFVYIYSRSNNLTLVQTLQQLCAETLDMVRDLRGIAKSHPTLQDHVESFIRGYICYHLCVPRYRLDELDLDCVKEARKKHWN